MQLETGEIHPANLDQNRGSVKSLASSGKTRVGSPQPFSIKNENKMKTFFLIASGIMSFFLSMNMDTNPSLPEVASQAHMQVISDCEEEPIILRGHVRGAGGIAVPFGQVVLKKLGQATPSHTATTDSNGDYTIVGIQAGVYKLGITASGYQPKLVTVTIVNELERSDTLIAQ